MLESVKGPVVLEVNLSPGIQGITAATKINVADKIAKYLYENTMALSEEGKTKVIKEILPEEGQEVITQLDFRGDRILLPEFAAKMAKFKEDDEFALTIKKGNISIKKTGNGK